MKSQHKKRGAMLITVGCFFLLLGVFGLFNPKSQPEKRISGALACMTVGLPLLGLGTWRMWDASKQQQQENRDRLQSTFYRLIQESNGQLTVLTFAMAAQLSAQEAKQYLDEKAKEFDANFAVTEENGVCYLFEIRKSAIGNLPNSGGHLEA
jgi:hypothetical protein